MGDPVTFHEISRKIVRQVSFHSINLSLVHSGLVVQGSWAIQGNNSESKNHLGNSGLFVKGFWAIQGNNLHVQWQPKIIPIGFLVTHCPTIHGSIAILVEEL